MHLLRLVSGENERDEKFRKSLSIDLKKELNGKNKAKKFWNAEKEASKGIEDAKNNIASTKVMPQIVENDNNVLPAGNLSSTSDPNHQNNSKKCKVAIEYFEGKGLSQSEIQNALEKEKFTTEEIGYIMNRVNFTKV
eukprot:g9856.t1